MDEIVILGIRVKETFRDATRLQKLFSNYGCVIKTRLGLNEIVNEYAGKGGLILLELAGDPGECQRLEVDLAQLEGILLQKMVFPID